MGLFGSKNAVRMHDMDEQIAEQQKEIEDLRKKLERSEAELESVNTSTHLGIWKCYYDEEGSLIVTNVYDQDRQALPAQNP